MAQRRFAAEIQRNLPEAWRDHREDLAGMDFGLREPCDDGRAVADAGA